MFEYLGQRIVEGMSKLTETVVGECQDVGEYGNRAVGGDNNLRASESYGDSTLR